MMARHDMAAALGMPDGGDGFRATVMAQNVREPAQVDAALSAAVRAGAALVKPAAPAAWGGYLGVFADPDGHLWEIVWNPDFTLDEAGRVVL